MIGVLTNPKDLDVCGDTSSYPEIIVIHWRAERRTLRQIVLGVGELPPAHASGDKDFDTGTDEATT